MHISQMKIRCFVILMPMVLLPTMQALASPMTLPDVIHQVWSQHPDLQMVETDVALAHNRADSLDHLLQPKASVRAFTRSDKNTPSSPFATERTQQTQLTGNISQILNDGSTLSAQATFGQTRLTYPATVPANFQSAFNPAYEQNLGISYRYPLLQGNGLPSYHQQRSAWQAEAEASEHMREQHKEQLASQAIGQYFQLQANLVTLKLANDAVQRSKKLLQYQKEREDLGLIEAADRLQAEAQLAARHIEQSNAAANVQQSKHMLNRLMLRSADSELTLAETPSPLIFTYQDKTWDSDAAVEDAQQQRPVFKAIDARIHASDLRLNLSKDKQQIQLDVIAEAGTRSLSTQSDQAFTQNKYPYVSLGVELSSFLDDVQTDNELRRAALDKQRILLEQKQAVEALRNELTQVRDNLQRYQHQLKLVQSQFRIEQKKFQEEIRRYRDGRSDTATLIRFENDLHAIEIQEALQRISVDMTRYQWALSQGRLLPALSKK